MNKLSHILLSKQKEEENNNPLRENSKEKNDKNTFNKYKLDRSLSDKGKIIKQKKPKFLYVSLAMMSGRGLNTEDRTILRKMRFEKGGVVDLAQEKLNKNKFKIKKAKRSPGGQHLSSKASPKYKEKAAKIIQGWWRELKDICNFRLKQIIFIQSVWKGRWVRKNIYDLLYLNYLYLSFCEIIEKTLADHKKRKVLNKLKEIQKFKQSQDKNKLKSLVLKLDKKRIMIIKKYWDKWDKLSKNENIKTTKGKTLIQIRADKENKTGLLRTAFTTWNYIIKMEDMKKHYNNAIEEEIDNNDKLHKEKFKGLFKIIEGVNKLHKKVCVEDTTPKLKKYLLDIAKKKRLTKIINKKSNVDNLIIKKYLHKWFTNHIYDLKETNSEENKKQLLIMKAKMFKAIIENFKRKKDKNLLRKNLYKYYKNTIILSNEEEKENILKKYKESEMIRESENKYYNEGNPNYSIDKKSNNTPNKKNNYSGIKRIGLNNVSDNLEACKILEKYTWHSTYKYPLKCFIKKINSEKIIIHLLKIIKIREKILRIILKKKLYEWRKKTFKKINSDLALILFLKTLKMIIENNTKKKLSRRFYQWQKITNLLNNKNSIFAKSKNTYDFIDYIRKYSTKKNANFFIGRLKKTKRFNISIEVLKKIITKLNNNHNKLILKLTLNKWKNKTNNYAIGKLKGKLLLTLYGKYKINKNKDLILKSLSKWKNNTIVLDRIKNKINKDNLETLKQISNNEYQIILLKSIIRNMDRKKNIKYLYINLNFWRKYAEYKKSMMSKAKVHLLKHNINRNAEDLLNRLKSLNKNKRIYSLLSRFIFRRAKMESIILMKFLLRWKNKMYALKIANSHLPYRLKLLCILLTKNDKENLQRGFTKWKYGDKKQLTKAPFVMGIKIIKQIFCKKPFRKFVNTMKYNNTKVLRPKGEKLISILTKINKGNPFDSFIKKTKLIIRIKKFENILPDINNKIKKYLLYKYINIWNDKAHKIDEKSKRIISSWIKNKVQSEKDKKNKRKKELLKKFVLNLIKDNKYKKWYVFSLWNKITNLSKEDFYSRIIQKFCKINLRKIIDKNKDKKLLFKNLIIKLYRKKFFKKINNRNNDDLIKYITKGKINNLIKIKLRKLIRDKSKRDIKKLFQKLFDKWKTNTKTYLIKIILIQNKTRIMLSKNKLKGLRRLKEILIKLYLQHKNNDKSKLIYGFAKWLKINRKTTCQNYAKVIQNFIRNKLGQKLHNKYSNYFRNLAKNRFIKYIINIIKIKKLKDILRRIQLKKIFGKIKNSNIRNKIALILLKLIRHLTDRNEKLLLKYYLLKWKIYNIMKKNSAIIIQKNFRDYIKRKNSFVKNEKIIILRKIILKLDNNNLLRYKFFTWFRNAKTISCNKNAIIIQKFCRRILKNRTNKTNDLYKNLAQKIIKIKVNPKDFFIKLKYIKFIQLLQKISDNYSKRKLDVLKDGINKIKNYIKMKQLLIIILIPDALKRRLIKKYLDRWSNKSLNHQRLIILLLSIIKKYGKHKKDILNHYLNKWLYLANVKKTNKNANIIKDFCRRNLKNRNTRNLWQKLVNLIKHKIFIKNIYEIRNRVGLLKLTLLFIKHPRRNIFNQLKNNRNYKLFIILIKRLFDTINKRRNKDLLKKYFIIWKSIIHLRNNKEEALKNMLKTLEKRKINNSVNYMNKAFILIKLLRNIPRARAIYFLRYLKEQINNKDKYKNLSDHLTQTNNELIKKGRNPLVKKIFKIYAYKVLNKLFDNIQNIRKNYKLIIIKELFSKMYLINIKKNEYKYKGEYGNNLGPKITQLKFHGKSEPQQYGMKTNYNGVIYKRLIPYLIQYLNKKIIYEKLYCFNIIFNNSKADQFCHLYKKFVYKTNLPDKEDLIDSLKYCIIKKLKKHAISDILYKLMRKTIIRKIKLISEPIGNLSRLLHLVKITMIHRDIARDRWLLKIIRKWRFMTFVKIMAMKKMELMYKDLHVTYLEMADSVLKEDLFFGRGLKDLPEYNNMDLFNFNDPCLLKGAKLYKNVKKQYVFEPNKEEEEKTMKMMVENIKTYDKIKEIEIESKKSYTKMEDDDGVSRTISISQHNDDYGTYGKGKEKQYKFKGSSIPKEEYVEYYDDNYENEYKGEMGEVYQSKGSKYDNNNFNDMAYSSSFQTGPYKYSKTKFSKQKKEK